VTDKLYPFQPSDWEKERAQIALASREKTPNPRFTKQLEEIDWPIDYGNVKIQLRAGKPTLVTIERTIKLD